MADHMPDVERLLRQFIEDFEADRSTRPQAYLEQVGGSDRVLDALASLTGTTRDALRAAARGFAPRPGEAGARALFARTATPDPGFMETTSAGAPAARRRSDEAWDEVDELFRGAV